MVGFLLPSVRIQTHHQCSLAGRDIVLYLPFVRTTFVVVQMLIWRLWFFQVGKPV